MQPHEKNGRVPVPAGWRLCILLIALAAMMNGVVRGQSIQFTTMSGFSANGMEISANDFVMLGETIPGYWAGEIDITVTKYDGQNVFPAQTVPAFCIQLTQDINLGKTYTTYTVGPLSQANPSPSQPNGTLTATAVKNLTTLYYLFYQGDSSSDWTAKDATAFQLDCWKITSNPGNYIITGSSAGSSFYDQGWASTSSTAAAVVALAQTWLTDVSATNVTTGGQNEPVALISGSDQNLLFTQQIQEDLIPFKINAWPGLAVLSGVMLFRMRRRMRPAR